MKGSVSEAIMIAANGALSLPLVDGLQLPAPVRDALRPGEELVDRRGVKRRLPRWFYEVDSWNVALQVKLAPNFSLWEFLGVDVREALPLRGFPRYVPCAVTALAAHLEVFRAAVGTYVHISANGGYRSPKHRLSRHASLHCWGTAANIYRIGDTFLDTEDAIRQYSAVARSVLPAVWIRPYGPGDGYADDHLHLDIGYTLVQPSDPVGGVPALDIEHG